MCHRTVLDFVNRRMMSQTISSRGDDAMTFTMVYADGQATVKDAFSEKPIPCPKSRWLFWKKGSTTPPTLSRRAARYPMVC